MNSSSTHFITSERMGFYQPIHQIGAWSESYKANGIPDMASSSITVGNPQVSPSTIVPTDAKFEHQSEGLSSMSLVPCQYDPDGFRPPDKIQRRLAQNREAARKSRLRKKAYVKQLEISRLKLIQLEQDVDRAKQQGVYADNGTPGYTSNLNPGVVEFERDYARWLDEQNKQIFQLRSVLNSNASDEEIQRVLETAKTHYCELFRMKAVAASCDVFYLLSGMWKSSVERMFLWIGGFRPSELLKVLRPQLETLTEQQYLDVGNLSQSCKQAEEALSQGMEMLQQIVAHLIAAGQFDGANGNLQVEPVMEKLEGLIRFTLQADHLRQETLHQISLILTTQQAAKWMVLLGEFFLRLRTLSSIWTNRCSDQT